jgi:hypothetical protein
MNHLPATWALRYSLEIFGSLAFGVLMANLVEVPVLRLRDR